MQLFSLLYFYPRGLFQLSEDVAKANGVRGHHPHAVTLVAVECPGPPCEGNSAKITEGELLRCVPMYSVFVAFGVYC